MGLRDWMMVSGVSGEGLVVLIRGRESSFGYQGPGIFLSSH